MAATGHNTGSECIVRSRERPGSWRDQSWQTDDHPVVCVNRDDALAYVRWLRRETGERYRIPSDSEWEYAARAGTTTPWYWGDRAEDRCEYANGADSDDGWERPAPVGSFRTNGFGLHDMAGNVSEAVEDCLRRLGPGLDHVPADGSAWTRSADDDCQLHANRSGSWADSPVALRSARRVAYFPESRSIYGGIRVARTLDVP